MIPIDRETMLIVAIVACVAATTFLFRELGKTKEELNGVKGFSSKMMNHLVVQESMIRKQNSNAIKEVEEEVSELEASGEKSEE
jgi:TATA-binding protein-associated factor Taf7|tara:strand:- start:3028 stop:3279 length:252 start_codon:yes stop_codon:yes gene_type:complete